MSDASEERLYGLIEIAERQQAAAQTALEGLAAERAALKAERERLGQDVHGLNLHVRTAVLGAVAESMREAAETGAEALKSATGSLVLQLDNVGLTADQAEASLRRVVLWASGRLLAWFATGIAVVALLGWLVSNVLLWWDIGAIRQVQEQKVELEGTVAGLKANRDAWEKAGMLGRVEHCGPQGRLCVAVDESAGTFGERKNYRVIQGN